MPSPFPGMDPFLESPEWESFHSAFMIDVADALSELVPDRYVVRAEKRVFVDHGENEATLVADGVVLREPESASGGPIGTSVATLAAVEVQLAMPEEHRETYLEIRSVATREVVTVIELLSPANKRSGEGMHEYRRKLDHVLRSGVHFVEIDLLRGGRRCSTRRTTPGYQVLISRAERRPRADAYRWTLRGPLPTVPIPLHPEDGDVQIDLQDVFTRRYDRGHFARTLDYDHRLSPRVSDPDAEWIRERIRAWRADRET